jgi:iron complex outermembrane receptor protein
MKKVAPDYTKPLTVKLGGEVNPAGLRCFAPKNFVRRIITLAFAFVLFLSVAFAQKVTISGTVRAAEGPLAAATVAAGKATVVTDNNGRFSIPLNPGNHTLAITHVGYKKVLHEVNITNDNASTIDISLEPSGNLDEVTVLGSRSLVQRSNLNTAVPVDVFSSQQLVQTAQASLSTMLNFSAPSFNASRPSSNETVTLRGLNPDQLLILVNGTRRHSMAYITAAGARGILGPGTVANDINSIPFTAVEKIEILRDGAAAQYGSDAIAGVINIELKKSTGKTTVQLQTGQYYKGDGENLTFGVNHGFSLSNKGFINVSADLRLNNSTYRGGPHTGTVYKNIPATATPATAQKLKAEDDSLVRVNNFDRNQVSNAGSSKTNRAGILLNGGYTTGKKVEIFWTAMANTRTSDAPGFTFPKNTNQINPELFPNGFRSIAKHRTTDLSGIAGVKGETNNRWRWEYSSAYGYNHDHHGVDNTNNASQYYTLGKAAPTSFHTATLVYGQLTNNLQFSKSLSSNPAGSSNISMGAEWRLENYQTKPGDEAGWKNYDSLGRKPGGAIGTLVVSPQNAVNKSRNVRAAYIDFETEVARRLLVDLAARFEHYSDFGGNLAGKIAARYKLSDKFSIRGSLNNGFRAPSLQQRYWATTNNGLSVRGTVVTPVVTGTFRNDSPVAQAFGIPSLQAERSVNVGGGITAAVSNNIRMTVDAYWIEIKNRIVVSGRFDTTNREVKEILIPFATVTQAQFYVNAINTRTKGADIILNGNWKIKKANLLASLAGNFTQTRLFGDIKTAGKLSATEANLNTLFGRQEKARLELGQPDSKIIMSLNYKTKKFGVVVRNTRFGGTGVRFSNPALNPDENFSPKILTDLSLSYTPKSWLTFTAGANNIFDVYPDRLKDARNTQEGAFIYSLEASPFGFYGGYYFVGMGIEL